MGDTSNLILSWRSVMIGMVCLPIFICACLLWFKPYESSASRLLAVFLFLCVFAFGPQIIGFSGFYTVWPSLTFFPFSVELWIGPLFYLHAFMLIKGQKLGKRKWLLLPGVLQFTYYTCAFLGLGDYQQKWAYSKEFHSPFIDPVEGLLAALFLAIALVKVWKMNAEYKAYLQRTQSVAVEFEPIWLDRMIMAILVSGVIFIGLELAPFFIAVSYIDAFPFHVLLIATLAWISIEAVWRLNQVFPKLLSEPVEQPSEKAIGRDWQREGKTIEQAVLTNEWFLLPRFSLKELARNMASNEVYVSKAINQGLQKSFNDFINQLRISHAKHLMLTSKQPVLTIALDSGFNSKATFNRVFRDICAMTPSQFKNSQE